MTTPETPSPSIGFYHNIRDTRLKTRPLSDIAKMVVKGSRELDALTRQARSLYRIQEDAFKAAGSPEQPRRDDLSHADYYAAYDSYKALKYKLPCATFSGTFQKRTDSTMVLHSGLIGIDLDHVGRAGLDAEVVRSVCAQKPFTVAAFISPSGDGVKCFALVTPVPQSDAEHRRAFDQVVAAYADVAPVDVSDPSGKNPARLCLLPFEPEATFKHPTEVPPLEVDLSEVSELEPDPSARPAAVAPTPPTRHIIPSDDDAATDRDALRFVNPPDKGGGQQYNTWVSWLRTLKAVGFSAAEAEAWSATGARYTKGDALFRWDRLPDDDPEVARDKLRGFAYNHGWLGIPAPIGTTDGVEEVFTDGENGDGDSENASLSKPLVRAMARGEPSWYALGKWFGSRLVGQYLFHATPRAPAWWRYADHVWRVLLKDDYSLTDDFTSQRYLLSKVVLEEGYRHLAESMVRDREWASQRGRVSDFWAGLRSALRGPEPRPASHHAATPVGVVDLKTSRLLPHDPSLGIRGLTAGRYLPDQVEAHWRVLEARFGKVFTPAVLRDYVGLCGLSLTGLAQSHRAIVLIVGKSGSGKGGAVNTVVRALGDRGLGVSSDWLERRGTSDIDATTTDVLENQPAVIAVGELGGDTKLVQKRVLSLTGNEPIASRRPHGPNLYGTVTAQVWSTAVNIPRFPRETGIERRLAVLPTLAPLDAWERDEEGGWSQDLLDAVVTLACIAAAAVYRPGYVPPAGPEEVKADVLMEMDPLSTWLEALPDACQGQPMMTLLERAKADLGDPKVSSKALGDRVAQSKRWYKDRSRVGRGFDPMTVYLKDAGDLDALHRGE